MLGLAIERIGVDALLDAGKKLNRAAFAVESNSTFDEPSGLLRAIWNRAVDLEQPTGHAAERAHAIRQRPSSLRIDFGDPRVIDIRVLNGSAAFNVEIEPRTLVADALQKSRAKYVPRNRHPLRAIAEVSRDMAEDADDLGGVRGSDRAGCFERVVALVG